MYYVKPASKSMPRILILLFALNLSSANVAASRDDNLDVRKLAQKKVFVNSCLGNGTERKQGTREPKPIKPCGSVRKLACGKALFTGRYSVPKEVASVNRTVVTASKLVR